MLTYILFVVGFALLIKGADLLVKGASALGGRLGVSELIIGLTVVAFGTSAPELVVNIFATTGDVAQIAIGNVLGSNIFNIFLILGISAIILPLTVHQDTVWVQIPFCLLAMLALGALAGDSFIDTAGSSTLTRSDGITLLLFFTIFMYYLLDKAKKQISAHHMNDTVTAGEYDSWIKITVTIITGLLGLYFGGQWIVNGAVELAEILNVSQSIIAVTIVAAGTSLPELVTSAMAARRNNADLAVGNIVGSNIFNVFFILGISSAIRPLAFSTGDGINLLIATVASLILFLVMFTGKRHRLDRWEGIAFIGIYAGFTAYTLMQV